MSDKPWSPWDDTRTNAELRLRWEELHREGNASRTKEEADRISEEMGRIEYTHSMRRMHNIADDWRHPRRGDQRWKDAHGAA